MGFFIGIGVILAVLVVVGLVMDRSDRKRGVRRGLIRPRGRRPRVEDAVRLSQCRVSEVR